MNIVVSYNARIHAIRENEPWILVTDYPSEYSIQDDRILLLTFPDLMPKECRGSFSPFLSELCTMTHVQQIIQFVKDWQTQETLYVSCDAGKSRSAAIANGIIQHFQWNKPRFDIPEFHPNPWITSLFQRIGVILDPSHENSSS